MRFAEPGTWVSQSSSWTAHSLLVIHPSGLLNPHTGCAPDVLGLTHSRKFRERGWRLARKVRLHLRTRDGSAVTPLHLCFRSLM